MGIPLRGRDFRDAENKSESRVAIVNETFAKKFFNGQADRPALQLAWANRSVLRDCWCAKRKIQLVRRNSKPALYTPVYRETAARLRWLPGHAATRGRC